MLVIVENGRQMAPGLQKGFWEQFYRAVEEGWIHGRQVQVWMHPTSAEVVMECGEERRLFAKIPRARAVPLGPGHWAIQEFRLERD